MLELLNVSFGFGEKEVLKNLSLRIKDGEFVTLTGPNGSGKTTLALLLAGILKPQIGEVIIEGVKNNDSEGFEEKRRSVGIVFENPDNQFITTSVERELAFGLENIGIKREEIRKRVEETLKRFSIGALRFRPPHTLSGGEKQKVAIASILILNPKYLILDEPTIYLDPTSREIVLEVVDNLRGNISIILISQFPNEILMGDKIYFLTDGILEGPFEKESAIRKGVFQIPSLVFLNVLEKRRLYDAPNIPDPEVLCDEIEVRKKKVKHR
ncbi:MAG: ATP-binding cassette domain-containing protein [Candidatus Cloacimonadota bacterium]|nr:MAG: ATP-binding cassette domain-containing protein [Candidatus Cloacimonadota bacterium]